MGQDYRDILNIADVCLVSLKKGIEGLGVPSKTYGYFAYAKPVISIMSDKTELANNITVHKAGFNVLQDDIEGFIRAIETFVDNPELVSNFSRNALKIHEELYRKEKALKRYREIIDELIN